eukprot:945163-Alexandrium_andersonii.AAC.1
MMSDSVSVGFMSRASTRRLSLLMRLGRGWRRAISPQAPWKAEPRGRMWSCKQLTRKRKMSAWRDVPHWSDQSWNPATCARRHDNSARHVHA